MAVSTGRNISGAQTMLWVKKGIIYQKHWQCRPGVNFDNSFIAELWN